MKILLVHDYYASSAPSGENAAFQAERDLLSAAGFDVAEFTCRNDGIAARGWMGCLAAAASAVWNPFALARLKRLARRMQPDIIHVHNTFPLLSPAVLYAADRRRTAVVVTLHNHRLFCPAGVPMRAAKPCSTCIERSTVLPAIAAGCYRNSSAATLPIAASVALHRALATWARKVDAFIALTERQRELMIRGGLPGERVFVKPNFAPPALPRIPWEERQAKVVAVGRLSPEKGFTVAVKAWRCLGPSAPELEIVGDGPERSVLAALAHADGIAARVRFRGGLPHAEAEHCVSRAKLAIVPSVCYEAFPLVIPEFYCHAVPVVASRAGSLAELVAHDDTGLLFEPGDARGLARAVAALWADQPRLRRLGENARARYEAAFSPETNVRTLVEIYRRAVSGVPGWSEGSR